MAAGKRAALEEEGSKLAARLVDVGDAQLSVCEAGSGHPILFLHGNASRWQHWEPQLRALSNRFRCLAFDQRGYGASSPASSTSLSRMADDTAALCRMIGVGHAYIVGLSMGSAVAQALALRHPGLVDGLVLAGMPRANVPPPEAPELSVELFRAMLTAAFSPRFQQAQPDVVARVIDEILQTNLDLLRNFSTADTAQVDPNRITAPALVIAAELDAYYSLALLRELAELLPAAEYLELPGAGHVMNLEEPEAFTAAIVRFIDAHPCPR